MFIIGFEFCAGFKY